MSDNLINFKTRYVETKRHINAITLAAKNFLCSSLNYEMILHFFQLSKITMHFYFFILMRLSFFKDFFKEKKEKNKQIITPLSYCFLFL